MNLILTSQDDPASLNIRSNLFSLDGWKKIGMFNGFPAYKNEDYYMVHIKGPKIYAENVDEDIKRKLGIDFENIIVASKHKSESKMRSLTVHPIGNWGTAEYGGKSGCVVTTNPHLMTQALRIMKKNKIEEYNISFEATHHGPYLSTPTFFIEIGSTEEEWRDDRAGEVIAKTILELEETKYPPALGFGGGHYMPRVTDVALEYKISFGHLIPRYAVPNINEKIIKRACEKSDNCKMAYIHKKGLKGEERSKVRDILEKLNIRIVTTKDLEKILL